MGKFKCSTKCSRARSKARNFGHYKTSFGGKHVRVTVGTKGIHTSIKMGPVTYKPGSGRYSVKTPIKGVTYYGKTNSHSHSHNNYTNDIETEWKEIRDVLLISAIMIPMIIVVILMNYYEEEIVELLAMFIRMIFGL